MNFPKLKNNYWVEQVPGEGFFLLAEDQAFVLEGQDLMPIVPLLDGTRTVEQILAAASPFVAPPRALQALEVLRQSGHLEEADPQMPPQFAAFWSELGVESGTARRQLAQTAVEVVGLGGIDPKPLVGLLRSFGIGGNALAGPALRVVLVADYLDPELARYNQLALAERVPWLVIKPVGLRLWLGPLIVPGQTACWRCLETRLRANREVEGYIERKTGRPGPFPVARARLFPSEYQAYAMAVTQLVRWLVTGRNEALESRLLVADVTGFSFGFHDVVRRPTCADCGSPLAGTRAGAPVVLQRQALDASSQSQGGLRSESPEVTFQRYQRHISPITGIVKAVLPSLWHGAGPLRVYTAGHNFALKSDHLFFLKDGLRTHSSGKGRTDAQARTSALCEALERYSGVFRGDEPRRAAAFADLGEDAVDPRSVLLFSEKQYAEREAWLARGARFQVVPLPFDPRATLEWTPAWSLTRGRQRLLPTSYAYYNYPGLDQQFYCWADSNGAAAGVTLEEAMLQGLLELVERDAVAIWWYNRIARPGVDLEAFDDGFITECREFYRSRDREVWVLDLTSDLGIPVFTAISRRVGGPTEDIMLGFGAHFDAKIALNRALTELNQFIPALLNIGPDGRTHYVMGDGDALRWWQNATLATEPYLAPAGPAKRPEDFAPPASSQPAELLQRLIDQLEAAGHEVLVLDQTRPDIGLPVVKMVVPGLRHFWARFAPGRLYDVPVRLGWRDRPCTEDDLNPTPMFL